VTKKASGWLLGCGIGCGVLLLGAILTGVSGAFWLRGMLKGFDDAVEARTQIEERYGTTGDFTPAADGSIPVSRMEAFLAVREALGPSRRAIAAVFSEMPLSKEAAEELHRKPIFERLAAVFDISRSAMGLAGSFGDFFRARNEALLEAEMGLGEYTYIYSVAYYSLLGHSPSDGPVGARLPGDDDSGKSVKMMGPRLRSRIRGDLLHMLENQLGALPAGASGSLRASLSAEIEAMKQDSDRLPWHESLPEAIRASLEPWHGKLEESWAPATNGFELGIDRKSGKYSFTAD